jgi:sugar/nucleoside kinase (ribokinase family)
MKKYILTIGNAITDIVCHATPEIFLRHNLIEGSMMLINQSQAQQLAQFITPNLIVAGGSASNTASALGLLGVDTSFFGVLGSDDYADVFITSLQESKVNFVGKKLANKSSAISFILVSDSGERTMATNLASASDFADIDMQNIAWQNFDTIYIEGYLYDKPSTIKAINYTINQAIKYNIKLAFSLSDLFCVTRHKQDFLNLLPKLDLLFANKLEIANLCLNEQFNLAEIQQFCQLNPKLTIVVTDSGNGCLVVNYQHTINVATKVIAPLDTTGAGDVFAAGFLYGLRQNYSLLKSAEFANFLAGKIIQQYGARFNYSQINNVKFYE